MNNLQQVMKEAREAKERWHWRTMAQNEAIFSTLLSGLEEAQREIERLREALDMIEIHNGSIDSFDEIDRILLSTVRNRENED